MHRHTIKPSGRSLSTEDKKALDVLLDHGHSARDARLTRHSPVVPPRRITAVSKVLNLLSELPTIDPPADLVSRTMQRIDRNAAVPVAKTAATDVSTTTSIH
jgi:hypothetical protein